MKCKQCTHLKMAKIGQMLHFVRFLSNLNENCRIIGNHNKKLFETGTKSKNQ